MALNRAVRRVAVVGTGVDRPVSSGQLFQSAAPRFTGSQARGSRGRIRPPASQECRAPRLSHCTVRFLTLSLP